MNTQIPVEPTPEKKPTRKRSPATSTTKAKPKPKPKPRAKPKYKPAPKPPLPTGRPTAYTEELADSICELIVQGMSCNKISQLDNMPAKSIIYYWLSKHKSFLDKYTQALEIRSLTYLDEVSDIADDGSNDYYEKKGKNGETFMAFDSEHVQRSRLRIETRLKMLEKLQPRKYGAKVDLNHGVQEDNPIMQLLQVARGTKLAAIDNGHDED